MSIAWNYLDKRSAAMAALKDYRSVNGKLYLSHLGKKGNEYLSHPTKPL